LIVKKKDAHYGKNILTIKLQKILEEEVFFLFCG
jgi:hypothetical protein